MQFNNAVELNQEVINLTHIDNDNIIDLTWVNNKEDPRYIPEVRPESPGLEGPINISLQPIQQDIFGGSNSLLSDKPNYVSWSKQQLCYKIILKIFSFSLFFFTFIVFK